MIGVFDSGVGGLTVLKALMEELPLKRFLYFGDTARVPYGGRSPETIARYTRECALFLQQRGVDLLVLACNTAVSALSLKELEQALHIPVIGVVVPGAAMAASISQNGRIGVIGTAATIQSGIYQRHLLALLPHAHIASVACPLFVPLVEELFWNHPATESIVREYLAPLQEQNLDTLLLGCTHYPFLAPLIEREMGPSVRLVNPATACAQAVAASFTDTPLTDLMLNGQAAPCHCHYFVSDDPNKFQDLSRRLFGLHSADIEKVELTSLAHYNALTPA